MGNPQRRRILAPLALAAAAGIVLAGCSGTSGGSSSGDNTVTVYGTIVDAEAKLLQQSWADWAKKNDINIKYEGNQGVRDADRHPRAGRQPAGPRDLPAARPARRPRHRAATCRRPRPRSRRTSQKYWSKDWAELRHGRRHALRRAAHGERQGLRLVLAGQVRGEGLGQVPKTWDELMTLTTTIAGEDRQAAVVRGLRIRRGDRLAGHRLDRGPRPAPGRPEVYDEWVTHEIPFTDPAHQGRVRLGRRDPARTRSTSTRGFGDVKSINTHRRSATPATRARQRRLRAAPPGVVLRRLHQPEHGDARSARTPTSGRSSRPDARPAPAPSPVVARSSAASPTTPTPSRCRSTCRARSGRTAASSSAA